MAEFADVLAISVKRDKLEKWHVRALFERCSNRR